MTLYATGLRISEAMALEVSDIDSPRMLIRVRLGKGKRDRYVPLSETLLVQLRLYWKHSRPKGWLFSLQGSPLCPWAYPLYKRSAPQLLTRQV